MTRLLGLLALFVVILVIQAVALTEAFASSQGGAQLQLAASRPVVYLTAQAGDPISSDLITRPPPRRTAAMTLGSQLNLQGPQPLYL